jgi:hypothetical protein
LIVCLRRIAALPDACHEREAREYAYVARSAIACREPVQADRISRQWHVHHDMHAAHTLMRAAHGPCWLWQGNAIYLNCCDLSKQAAANSGLIKRGARAAPACVRWLSISMLSMTGPFSQVTKSLARRHARPPSAAQKYQGRNGGLRLCSESPRSLASGSSTWSTCDLARHQGPIQASLALETRATGS